MSCKSRCFFDKKESFFLDGGIVKEKVRKAFIASLSGKLCLAADQASGICFSGSA